MKDRMKPIYEEGIQVAAVAGAMMTVLKFGDTRAKPVNRVFDSWGTIADDVAAERFDQEVKWGPQEHDMDIWVAILLEEVGELAEAVYFNNDIPFHLEDGNELTKLLASAHELGRKAKVWLENHEWPEKRHQEVYDRER